MFTLYDDFAYDTHEDDLKNLDISENEKQSIIYEWLQNDLDTLQNIFDLADKFDSYIIQGNIERWNGHLYGYTTAERLTDVIYKAVDGWGSTFLHIYIDNHNNLIIEVTHHDGTNTLTVKGINIPTTLSDDVYCRLWDCVKGYDCFKPSDTRYFKSLGKQIKTWF